MPTGWGSISERNFLFQPRHPEQQPLKSVLQINRRVLSPKPHMPPQGWFLGKWVTIHLPLPHHIWQPMATQIPTHNMYSKLWKQLVNGNEDSGLLGFWTFSIIWYSNTMFQKLDLFPSSDFEHKITKLSCYLFLWYEQYLYENVQNFGSCPVTMMVRSI
jgi:hypothetical protein